MATAHRTSSDATGWTKSQPPHKLQECLNNPRAQQFEYYIGNFSTYSVTYAGLAGVMSALVFMYLMAAVFVLGAEFNASLGELARTRRRASEQGLE